MHEACDAYEAPRTNVGWPAAPGVEEDAAKKALRSNRTSICTERWACHTATPGIGAGCLESRRLLLGRAWAPGTQWSLETFGNDWARNQFHTIQLE